MSSRAVRIYLSFQGGKYATNNSNILVTRIGTTNNTDLTCHTDSTTCCRGQDNLNGFNGIGEWVFPNGEKVAQNNVTYDGFYWIRYYQSVRLYRQGDIQTPLGRYCCRIPDGTGVNRTFCVNLIGELILVIIVIN